MGYSRYAIDHFHLHHDEDDDRLQCGGWFHSAEAIQSMAIDIPGQPALSLPIEDRGLPSPGVADIVDPAAHSARFSFDQRMPPRADLDMSSARLNLSLERGDTISIDLGRHLLITRSRPKADRELVMRFEGLGDNCEFGLMQRQGGFERLGLLRYAGARHVDLLIQAIDNSFEGFATADDLMMWDHGGEWIAYSRRYALTFHTGVGLDRMDEDTVRAAEATKLAFMAQLLMEDFETAHKVFVRRVDENDVEAGLWTLYEALRRRGPNRLLWVTRAVPDRPHGHVERLADGLYRAFHSGFAPYENAHGFDLDLWTSLLRSAEAAMVTAAGDEQQTPVIRGEQAVTQIRKSWLHRLLRKPADAREVA